MALLLTSDTSLKHKFSPQTPPRPILSESPETSKAFYKLATTPSPRAKKRRSETPSPNESRSQQDPDENNRQSDYRDVPSGLGLGLGIPGYPMGSNRNSTNRDPLNWRFSNITKPSSTSEPPSPSPSESVAGEEVEGDDYSVYTLTPGPIWPPPPSATVTPSGSPRLEAVGVADAEEIDQQTPLSPLSPAITQLLDELSTLPRPASITEPPKHPVTTVQAWVFDMPEPGRGRGRGKVEVRRMRSWRNLRAEGIRIDNIPTVPAMPSPPITPPADATTPTQPGINTLPSRSLPSPPINYHHEPALDSPPPEEYEENEQDPRVENAEDDANDDVESIVEILPRKASEATLRPQASADYLYSTESTPNPNSDLVHEIEELLESSPIRQAERQASRERDLEEERLRPPNFDRLLSQESKRSMGTSTPGDEEFYTPKEQGTPFFEKSNPMSRSMTSLSKTRSASSLLREVAPTKSTSSLRREFIPAPLPELPIKLEVAQEVDPPETPTRPPIPRKSTSRSTIVAVQDVPPAAPTAPIPHNPIRPIIPQRRSSLSHSRNTSIDAAVMSNYPPVSLRPEMHTRGKSVDSSSLYDRERPDRRLEVMQHRRSTSADADIRRGEDDLRGRSRSIDEGPPQIPSRTSSLGKAGKPADLPERGQRPPLSRSGTQDTDSSERSVTQAALSAARTALSIAQAGPSVEPDEPATRRPPFHQRMRTDSSDYMQVPRDSNSSVRDSVHIISGEEHAEVVLSGVVRTGAVKQVIVRSPSQKQAEFHLATPTIDSTPKIPQFDFGNGPELSLGQEDDANKNSVAGLPVVFQVIPPTPFAFGAGEDASKQLGLQVPQRVQIPATPDPTTAAGDYLLVKPMHISTPAPDSNINGDNLFAVPVDSFSFHAITTENDEAPSSSGGLLQPPEENKSTPPPGLKRPHTAPELITEYETAPPKRHRPKLKSQPTKLRQSKLHPWWRPKPEDESPQSSNAGTDTWSSRPDTATTTTTITSSTSAEGRTKKHKSLKLGSFEVEFVGVRGLLQERRKRKNSIRGQAT